MFGLLKGGVHRMRSIPSITDFADGSSVATKRDEVAYKGHGFSATR
jgi:hypothetical protein